MLQLPQERALLSQLVQTSRNTPSRRSRHGRGSLLRAGRPCAYRGERLLYSVISSVDVVGRGGLWRAHVVAEGRAGPDLVVVAGIVEEEVEAVSTKSAAHGSAEALLCRDAIDTDDGNVFAPAPVVRDRRYLR